MNRLKIFSGSSYPELAESICRELGIKLSPIKKELYLNGCFEIILEDNVRGCSVFIIQTSLPDPALLHQHIFETFQMINAAYKASAKEVTLVMPHFSYARSDKKWTGRMPIVLTLLASFFAEAGMKRIVGVEFHSPQGQSAFSTRTIVDHLETLSLFFHYFKEKNLNRDNAIILPGDEGFHKRAEKLGSLLQVPVGSVEKTRVSGEKVRISSIHGPIAHRKVIVFDDEILTGGTMKEIVERAVEKEAKSITLVATHALFKGKAIENLSSPHIEEIVVTDTVPIPKEFKDRLPLVVLPIAPLLASAIREIYKEGSLSKLFQLG
jgi:ribose-phosphate pyrophosphokinase